MEHSYTYKFGNICERDIDTLLLNSFVLDNTFIDLFTKKIRGYNFLNSKIIDVELSKTHPTWGESDVTVIFESNDKRYAILIEDKVGAQAQPDQCKRYFKRGDIGVKNKDYEAYFVFICAASEYIKNNEEAKNYPYSMSFEELIDYFKTKQDLFSKIRYEEILQALAFSKTPYKKIVDATATEFWRNYVEYARLNHPDLQLVNTSMEKSKKGDWPTYYTQLNLNKSVYIQHKMDRGIIDLTFNGMANRQKELSDFLHQQIGNYEADGFGIRPAGKSAVLRINLGKDCVLDFQKSFKSQIENVKKHFEAIYKLHLIAANLNYDDILKMFNSI